MTKNKLKLADLKNHGVYVSPQMECKVLETLGPLAVDDLIQALFDHCDSRTQKDINEDLQDAIWDLEEALSRVQDVKITLRGIISD